MQGVIISHHRDSESSFKFTIPGPREVQMKNMVVTKRIKMTQRKRCWQISYTKGTRSEIGHNILESRKDKVSEACLNLESSVTVHQGIEKMLILHRKLSDKNHEPCSNYS